MSTEKLSPFKLNDFILSPISIALNNSIFSIFSNLVFFDLANFFKASGLKEIIDKCFNRSPVLLLL